MNWIHHCMLAYSEKINEVSMVERVTWHPRVVETEAEWETILGPKSDMNGAMLYYTSPKPDYSVTSSAGDTTNYMLTCGGTFILSYKDSPDYVNSSQRVFDEFIANMFDKFKNVTEIQIDSTERIIAKEIEGLEVENSGGIIQSVELGNLVHKVTWQHVLTYIGRG